METRPESKRWLAKMLVSSAALVAALSFLAWAAPALRLYFYGLRYRMNWGRNEALAAVAKEALKRNLSPSGVRLILGRPEGTKTCADDSTEYGYRLNPDVHYYWNGEAWWLGKGFHFKSDRLDYVQGWAEREIDPSLTEDPLPLDNLGLPSN